MTETPASICAWQIATFGPVSVTAGLLRAEKELAEYHMAIASGDSLTAIAEEYVDFSIVFEGLCAQHGLDVTAMRDKKMTINRARKWRMTGPGHGQHVEDDNERVDHRESPGQSRKAVGWGNP